jgi:hypothetical protein
MKIVVLVMVWFFTDDDDCCSREFVDSRIEDARQRTHCFRASTRVATPIKTASARQNSMHGGPDCEVGQLARASTLKPATSTSGARKYSTRTLIMSFRFHAL